jgi:hypothetical protein
MSQKYNDIPIANPLDCNFTYDPMSLFLFNFSGVEVYAWACHTFDDALSAAAEWLEYDEPDVFVEPDYDSAAEELGAPEDWESEENVYRWGPQVYEAATEGLTYTEAGYLVNDQWVGKRVTDADTVDAVRQESMRALLSPNQ